MKKLVAVFGIALMLVGSVSAQDLQMKGKQSGAKSLNFTLGGFGSFGFGGRGPDGGVSMSFFLNSDAALRFGVQIASSSTTTPYFNAGNPTESGSDGKSSTFGIGASADYLMFMANASHVRPYMGAGVSVMMNSSSTTNAVISGGTSTEVKNNRSIDGLTFGLKAIVGTEFYIYSDLSFSAEYGLNLISLTSRADITTTTGSVSVTQKGGSTTNILGFGAAGATVHFYF